MRLRYSGLDPIQFRPLFSLDEAGLAARGMVRVTANAKPGFPCRVSLEDAEPGETLLLNGKILTGRDAAHKRIQDLLARGEALPTGVDFRNRFIYYVGPVDAVRDEAVGPAGHHAPEDQPDAVGQAIARWLARHQPEAP